MEPIVQILIAVLGGGSFSAIVVAVLNRRWAAKDKEEDKIDALVDAQKVLMVDRVRYLGQKYVAAGSIALEDKENLEEMYRTYKALGGNGHLQTIMEEVDRLPIARR